MIAMLEILVPLAPFLLLGYFIWTRHQRRMAEVAGARADEQAVEAEAIARLEDRVRVLERIVTDRGYDLSHQIDALRDDAPVSKGTLPPAH